MIKNIFQPGPVVLMGSGETSPSSGAVFEKVAGFYQAPVNISILETPAGFELNSPWVANRVANHLQTRLQNHKPEISVIPARRKETQFSPDSPELLNPLYSADIIFLGPGSPTYTARQLTSSLAYEIIRARQHMGSALVLASAATIAFGCQTMPVYEIFKAGMDLHWQPGLNFFMDYGLQLIIIPHWNNAEGGADLDTSRCFMGKDRFEDLRKIAPCDGTIVGIDEHTSLWMDFAEKQAKVFGKDAVHVRNSSESRNYFSGESFPLSVLGNFRIPDQGELGVRSEIWQNIERIGTAAEKIDEVPVEILHLVENREKARVEKNYAESDRLRFEAEKLGWRIMDTSDGTRIERV